VDHRKVLSGMLTPLGFEVVQASNGQEAIRQVALLGPDLSLIDLSMPTMDGWETSRLIRRNALATAPKNGRASGRARVGPEVVIQVVAGSYKKKKNKKKK